jgi:heat shock protein HslJ
MHKKLILSAATFTLIACGLTVDLGSTFELKHGKSASLRDTALKVTFHDINDQRCEIGSGCPEGGHADVTLKVTNDDAVETVSIVVPGNEASQPAGHAFNYKFTVNDLSPQPQATGASFPEAYELSLMITKQQSLADYYWELESMGFSGTQATPVLAQTLYALTFNEDNEIKGKKPCNKLRGDYQSTESSLLLNNLTYASTACEDDSSPEQDEQIAFFENAINGVMQYALNTGNLKIISSDSRELNFKGVKKTCPIPSNLPTDNFESCVMTCTGIAPGSMSCFSTEQREHECSLYCAIH